MYEENKINYLKVNIKIGNKIQTIRIYEYYINDIFKIIYEDSSYSILNIKEISKEEKKEVIKYVHSIIENEKIHSLNNFNYEINRIIFKNIIQHIKNKNKEQSKINF